MNADPVPAGRPTVIVIGAGAAGLMAAGRAAGSGADVLLLEKTASPGRKMRISGKTRCNVSNTADLEEFILRYGENGPFLYSAFKRYFRDELLDLLKCRGVDVKAERGGRIFPASDDAGDVVEALTAYAVESGARLVTGTPVSSIIETGGRVTGVTAGRNTYPASAVIVATGGASYSSTGSSGDGYRLAVALGHTIVPPPPRPGPAGHGGDRPCRLHAGGGIA